MKGGGGGKIPSGITTTTAWTDSGMRTSSQACDLARHLGCAFMPGWVAALGQHAQLCSLVAWPHQCANESIHWMGRCEFPSPTPIATPRITGCESASGTLGTLSFWKGQTCPLFMKSAENREPTRSMRKSSVQKHSRSRSKCEKSKSKKFAVHFWRWCGGRNGIFTRVCHQNHHISQQPNVYVTKSCDLVWKHLSHVQLFYATNKLGHTIFLLPLLIWL